MVKKGMGIKRVLQCVVCMGSADHSKVLDSDNKILYNKDKLNKVK